MYIRTKKRFTILRMLVASTLMMMCVVNTTVPTKADDAADQYAALQQRQQQLKKTLDSKNADLTSATRQKAMLEESIRLNTQQIAILNTQISTLNAQIDSKSRDIAAAQTNIDANLSLYKQQLRAMYEAGNVSYISVLLSSESFTDLLSRAEVLSVISDHNNKLIDTLSQATAKLHADQASLTASQVNLLNTKSTYTASHSELTDQKAQQSQIAAQKATEISITKQQQSQVDAQLNAIAAQWAAENQHNSASGAAIVAYARQYLGYRYVFDTNGPNTFDCSGLTQWVYAHVAGITLPHFADDQAKGETIINNKIVIRGHKISNKSDLQPGDLLFFDTEYYGTGYAGHVGIYIGNGQMLAADTYKRPIEITNLSDWDCYLWGWRFL